MPIINKIEGLPIYRKIPKNNYEIGIKHNNKIIWAGICGIVHPALKDYLKTNSIIFYLNKNNTIEKITTTEGNIIISQQMCLSKKTQDKKEILFGQLWLSIIFLTFLIFGLFNLFKSKVKKSYWKSN